jgi:hypothetical protein
MAKSSKQQAAIAMSMKAAGKKPKMKLGGGPLDIEVSAGAMKKTKTKERSADGNYVKKTVTRETPGGNISTTTKTRRTVQGIFQGAPRVDKFKKGGIVGKSKKK